MKLPKGWSEVVLADVVDFRNGKAHENIIDETGTYYVVNSKFISSEGRTFKLCKEPLSPLYKDDIVMVMSDIPNGKALAKCFFIPENNKYTLNQRICSFKATRANAKYLYYCLNRNKYFLGFDTGVGQTNLRKEEILDCPILLPPLTEQKKIVYIFQTWDRAIEKLKQLIDAKKRLKKSLMQKLLSGQVRFKEFDSRKWQQIQIRKLCEVRRGASPRPIDDRRWWGGNVGWVRIADVTASNKYLRKTKDYLSPAGVKESVKIPKGEVIFSICGTIGSPIIIDMDACIHDGFVWFDGLPKDLNREYLYYFLQENSAKFASFKQTGSQGNLNTDIIGNYQMKLPSSKEQDNIALILSSIDKHMDLLATQFNVLKKQKEGLMQKLLTGRIRVKV